MGNVKIEIVEPMLSENIWKESFQYQMKDYKLTPFDTFLLWIRKNLRYDVCKNERMIVWFGVILFFFFVCLIGFFIYFYFFYIQK